MKFRERFAHFMMGRNGLDQMGRGLLWAYIALLALSFLGLPILRYAALALIVYLFWRMLSKNRAKRQAENWKYIAFQRKFTGWFSLQRRKWKDRKNYRYRSCSHCNAIVRLPNKKGEHVVSCPKCHQDFDVRI